MVGGCGGGVWGPVDGWGGGCCCCFGIEVGERAGFGGWCGGGWIIMFLPLSLWSRGVGRSRLVSSNSPVFMVVVARVIVTGLLLSMLGSCRWGLNWVRRDKIWVRG